MLIRPLRNGGASPVLKMYRDALEAVISATMEFMARSNSTTASPQPHTQNGGTSTNNKKRPANLQSQDQQEGHHRSGSGSWQPNQLNKPVTDGSHLVKTWEYLGDMGCSDDLVAKQQELLNHVRAWNGRMQVFGTVWGQDGMALFKQAQCLILALCSKMDVLWGNVHRVKEMRPEVIARVTKGNSFEPARDPEGILKTHREFLNTF
jgi:hypothetical protein